MHKLYVIVKLEASGVSVRYHYHAHCFNREEAEGIRLNALKHHASEEGVFYEVYTYAEARERGIYMD